MKVAFYSTTAEDLFRYRLPVAKRLREAGYAVLFVGPAGAGAAGIEQEGFNYRRLASSFDRMAILSDFAAGLQLGRIYRDEAPDIAHHYTLRGLVRGAVAARLAGVRWVAQSLPPLSDHAGRSRLLKPEGHALLRFALRHAEVTFRTHQDRQRLLSIDCVRPEQTHIIASSGIDLPAHPYVEEPARTPVVAMIGPLRSADAIGAFVEAARRLKSNGVDARFVLAATRAEPPAVPRPQLDRWQEEGLIEWWGFRQDEVHLVEIVHVACMLEGYAGELPDLLLEAAAAGRPIVAIDDPAVRHLVRNGETGGIIPPFDTDALERALDPLLRDGERRRCLGKNARRLVENEFSADWVARQTLAVYEQLFQKGRDV